jgi:predicted phosphodiesterase
MTGPPPDRFAVVADIHGNRWALEEVRKDIDNRGIHHVVNLGDCLYGPLDPAGTADILLSLDWPTVRGNEDRLIVEPGDDAPTLRFVRDQLGAGHLAWLAGLPLTAVPYEGVCLFHGTPGRDDVYLLHDVFAGGGVERGPEDVSVLLQPVAEPLVLCGHDHLPGRRRMEGGQLVVNPGSVGLQAYTDVCPFPHFMETGSPRASYAILAKDRQGWQVEHIVVTYDWEAAAKTAGNNGRDDWAVWLRTGVAQAGGGPR